jgi:phosphopantetheine adenylyltransferase
MCEYPKYSLDELTALHTAKKKVIKKFQRRPEHNESELKLLKSEKECLKRLIEARGGTTSGVVLKP